MLIPPIDLGQSALHTVVPSCSWEKAGWSENDAGHDGRQVETAALVAVAALIGVITDATAQNQKPNIVVIMGDDIGWFNIGAYHRGIMAGRTPNLDQL